MLHGKTVPDAYAIKSVSVCSSPTSEKISHADVTVSEFGHPSYMATNDRANNELERAWKKEGVAKFGELPWYLPGGAD